MRFAIQVLVILILGFFMELVLPWWSIAVAAFAGGLFLHTRMNFLAGFLGMRRPLSCLSVWPLSC